nr:hypothetical protein [Prolixibacteraceae bacterium]
MIKKSKLRYLLLAFAVLLTIWVIASLAQKKKGERTFTKELVSLRPDEVSELILFPSANKSTQIRLIRTGENAWDVESEG